MVGPFLLQRGGSRQGFRALDREIELPESQVGDCQQEREEWRGLLDCSSAKACLKMRLNLQVLKLLITAQSGSKIALLSNQCIHTYSPI